jgi:hypothetical protein
LQEHIPAGDFSIEKRSKYDEFLVVKSKIKHWEKFFATEFHDFVHKDWQNKIVHRATSYSLPKELDAHIYAVGQVADFPTRKRSKPGSILRKSHHGSSTTKVGSVSTSMAGLRGLLSKNSADNTNNDQISTTSIDEPAPVVDTIRNKGKIDIKSSDKILKAIAHKKTVNNFSSNDDGDDDLTADDDDTSSYPGLIVDDYVTPALISATYSIPGDYDTTIGNSLTSQAIYSTIEQTLSPLDLYCFQTFFGLIDNEISTSYHGYVSDDACYESVDNCIEANLDFQYIMSTAQNVSTIAYYDDYATWYSWMVEVASFDDDSRPDVISMSYGTLEIWVSQTEKTAFNTESIKLGLQGVTLIVASGDDGAVNFGYYDGDTRCGYWADFPSISPYWTVVGGTKVNYSLSMHPMINRLSIYSILFLFLRCE